MAERHILFATADERCVEELKLALGSSWGLAHAPDGPAAIRAIGIQHFDALIVDIDLFGAVDGALLELIEKTDSRSVRLVLAGEGDCSRVMRDVPGQHQFIAKPCRATNLKTILERTFALDIWSANADIHRLISQVRALPPMPSLYLEIQAALQSSNVTTEQISSIIARDMAMTTKLLQVLNSAGFGLMRKIHDLNEGVGILGFQTVKSMIITIKLMSEFDHVKPVYYSIDRLWRRSTAIARLARELTLLHTGDEAMAESAFAAGLLHDVGEAVLAATFDEQFQAVQLVAREEQSELWEAEKKHFGASHGELGAYLLGLWGMPLDLLEAAAMHDHPSRCVNSSFAPVTAVHIAHVWESELNPDNGDGSPAPQLDAAYLAQLGVLNRLEGWRKSLALPPSTKPIPAAPKKVVRKTPPVAKARPAAKPLPRRTKVLLATAGVAALMMAGWLSIGPATRVLARYQIIPEESNADQFPPRPRVQSAADTTNTSSTNDAASEPTNTVADTNSVNQTNAAPVVFPDLKLQGVFYSTNDPSAIINGRLIHLNEEIDGAHVTEITHSTVTIEFEHQQTKLSL